MVTKRVCIPFRHADRVRPYVAAVKAAGGEALAVSVDDSPSLEDMSGLLLMGGTDVNPKLYGQTATEHVDTPDDERDEIELQLLEEALARNLPVLAICRGMQLLNVHRGGTLIQHLGSPRHDTQFADKGTVAHAVAIASDTRLAAILRRPKVEVNSRHHQAVHQGGNGRRVSARAAEEFGVIEGIEDPDRRFVVGVQWHPEDQAPTSSEQRRLFEQFVLIL